MDCDPRAPVLVGAGQVSQRCDDPRDAKEPLELMLEAARASADDCGAPQILKAVQSVRVPKGFWPYSNPAALVREAIGAPKAETALAPVSGNSVQRLITDAAIAIARDNLDIALVVGGEAERSKRRAKSQGVDLGWTPQTDSQPDIDFSDGEVLLTRREIQLGLTQPATVFSLFENALRFANGEDLDSHVARIAELWAAFSRIAAGNPNAWSREALSADAIATRGPDNKWAAVPYTKRMCANMVVDLAAAVLVCSAEAAQRLNIPRDRWVFLHSATDASRVPVLPERDALHRSEAIRRAGQRALDLAETEISQIDHIDLYSCFPSAVQIGARELGIDLHRPLTVTGGLAFSGGPFNSYVLHSTATMLARLREDGGSLGLVSSIGGWMSKHAFAVYGSDPPRAGFAHANLDAELDDLSRLELAEDFCGAARIDAYALRCEQGEPSRLIAACIDTAGRRAWVTSHDPDVMGAALERELCGQTVDIEAAGTLKLT